MTPLTNPRLIYLKGLLFLFLGTTSAALLIGEAPTLKAILLLLLVVWCFCRAYYLAFYVIEHYVDPSYRFSGLGSFLGYLWARRRDPRTQPAGPKDRPPKQGGPPATESH